MIKTNKPLITGSAFGLWLLFASSVFSTASQADIVADMTVPLNSRDAWQILSYDDIDANTVQFSDQGMLIRVNRSASPLIFPFKESRKINQVQVLVELQGDIDLDGNKQGSKKADDFVFRFGLVHAGDKTLNAFQRMIAADWIKSLYQLAPEGKGIKHIAFYNIYSDPQLANQSRTHPLSDLLEEHFIMPHPGNGQHTLRFTINDTAPVHALWISCDGDDTDSQFSVLIKSIRLSAPAKSGG